MAENMWMKWDDQGISYFTNETEGELRARVAELEKQCAAERAKADRAGARVAELESALKEAEARATVEECKTKDAWSHYASAANERDRVRNEAAGLRQRVDELICAHAKEAKRADALEAERDELKKQLKNQKAKDGVDPTLHQTVLGQCDDLRRQLDSAKRHQATAEETCNDMIKKRNELRENIQKLEAEYVQQRNEALARADDLERRLNQSELECYVAKSEAQNFRESYRSLEAAHAQAAETVKEQERLIAELRASEGQLKEACDIAWKNCDAARKTVLEHEKTIANLRSMLDKPRRFSDDAVAQAVLRRSVKATLECGDGLSTMTFSGRVIQFEFDERAGPLSCSVATVNEPWELRFDEPAWKTITKSGEVRGHTHKKESTPTADGGHMAPLGILDKPQLSDEDVRKLKDMTEAQYKDYKEGAFPDVVFGHSLVGPQLADEGAKEPKDIWDGCAFGAWNAVGHVKLDGCLSEGTGSPRPSWWRRLASRWREWW